MVVTEVTPAGSFWEAGAVHQNYSECDTRLTSRGQDGYCLTAIKPSAEHWAAWRNVGCASWKKPVQTEFGESELDGTSSEVYEETCPTHISTSTTVFVTLRSLMNMKNRSHTMDPFDLALRQLTIDRPMMPLRSTSGYECAGAIRGLLSAAVIGSQMNYASP
jgi:hypothetical protein